MTIPEQMAAGKITNFDQQTELLTGKTNAMGIIETIKMLEREEGIEQGKTETIKNLLATKRFTVAEIANFANVSEAFVHKIKKMAINTQAPPTLPKH